MLKLIFFAVFVANLSLALTDTAVSEVTTNNTEIEVIPVDDTSNERIRCGPNQAYVFCPLCPSPTCRNKDQLIKCIRFLEIDRLVLCPRPRCQCINGFFMTDGGKCVKKEECPLQCGPNQVPSDCATNPCLPTCEEPELNTYCRPNPAVCKPGCICADGYVKDKNNTCVPKENCTTKCKENEEYTICPNQVCQPQDCKEVGYPMLCSASECGKPKCICKTGYVRGQDGLCIPASECPTCAGDPNQVIGCGNYCERCNGTIACPRRCLPNSCDCREGYKYDVISKKCVLPRECPPQCGRNQVLSDCGNNPCNPTCEKPDLDTYCRPNPANCKTGCVCAPGYLPNSSGVCVPKESCPVKCKENEEYTDCTSQICRPQSCKELGNPVLCLQSDQINVKCNMPGCVCKPDYVRDDKGVCIPARNCTSVMCTKPHEYYDVCPPDNCPPRTCEVGEVFTLVACKPPSDPSKCKPDCVCEPGYYRNQRGYCVTLKECVNCKENEEYTNCTSQICRPQSCKELGYPLLCLQSDQINAKCNMPGCVCQAGYVRDENGVCIPARNCTSCGGDPNAWSGCSNYCTRCTNYQNEARLCFMDCHLNGCDCRPGFVFDVVNKKCVSPKECPAIKCGLNEVVHNCANSPCIRNCATKDLNMKILCRPYLPGCETGCVCAEGYMRDKEGICIPIEKCPRSDIVLDDTLPVLPMKL